MACDHLAGDAGVHVVIGVNVPTIGGDLRAWTTPCLIAVAEDDGDFFEQARMAASEIPRARFVVIPGADHLGVDVAPVDTYLPAVLRLLREA